MTYRARCEGRKKLTQTMAVIINGVQVGTVKGIGVIKPHRAKVKLFSKYEGIKYLCFAHEDGLFNSEQALKDSKELFLQIIGQTEELKE